MSYLKKHYGDLIQFTGMIMLGVGVCCEIVYRADIYYILITVGAIIFSIGTKVKGH